LRVVGRRFLPFALGLFLLSLPSQTAGFSPTIPSKIVSTVESVLPEGWSVVDFKSSVSPQGWNSPKTTLYVKVEDGGTRFCHPDGFFYFSYYKFWFCPEDWQGEMKDMPYSRSDYPAYLLGTDDSLKVLYQTAGANVWSEGPEEVARAIGVAPFRVTQNVLQETSIEIKHFLLPRLPLELRQMRKQRQFDLVGVLEGPKLMYIEVALAMEDEIGAPQLTVNGSGQFLRESLARDVFMFYPEVADLYVRAYTDSLMADALISREEFVHPIVTLPPIESNAETLE